MWKDHHQWESWRSKVRNVKTTPTVGHPKVKGQCALKIYSKLTTSRCSFISWKISSNEGLHWQSKDTSPEQLLKLKSGRGTLNHDGFPNIWLFQEKYRLHSFHPRVFQKKKAHKFNFITIWNLLRTFEGTIHINMKYTYFYWRSHQTVELRLECNKILNFLWGNLTLQRPLEVRECFDVDLKRSSSWTSVDGYSLL